MKRRGRGPALILVLGAGAPCCSVGVRASDVELACREDVECVIVEELEQIGARCTVPCRKAAIHRDALERYQAELARQRRECHTITRLACDPEEVAPECRLGRCLAAPPSERNVERGAAAAHSRAGR